MLPLFIHNRIQDIPEENFEHNNYIMNYKRANYILKKYNIVVSDVFFFATVGGGKENKI